MCHNDDYTYLTKNVSPCLYIHFSVIQQSKINIPLTLCKLKQKSISSFACFNQNKHLPVMQSGFKVLIEMMCFTIRVFFCHFTCSLIIMIENLNV